MPHDPEYHGLDQRLQEIEIKMAFLERELAEYKDASHTLHARLSAAEEGMRALRRQIPESRGLEGMGLDAPASR